MKELTNVPSGLKKLMTNQEFKQKMVNHLNNKRNRPNQFEIGQINETIPTEKSFMDDDEKDLTAKCH